jgi:hypothetical protein
MKTKTQVKSKAFDGKLSPPSRPIPEQKMLAMRKHPTLALARRLARAGIVASTWSVEATDEAPPEAKDFIDQQLQPWRTTVLRSATMAMIDYGWSPFEIVYDVTREGFIGVKRVKPLLQSLTTILVIPETGEFIGLEQTGDTSMPIKLGRLESLLVSFEVEGTNWYGRPRIEDSELSYDAWGHAAGANDRYDRKMAGVHWVIHYPPGSSNYGGVEKDNYEVAEDILRRLESSGAIIVPSTIANFVDSVTKDSPLAWKIELLSVGLSPQYSFTDRLKYLDALMVRGLGMPERAILEGQFGTKAEATAHADFAITDIEQQHELICEAVNQQMTNAVLRLNWGEEFEDTVFVRPTPLNEAKRAALRALYMKLLESPEFMADEFFALDRDALRDAVDAPYLPEAEQDELAKVSQVSAVPDGELRTDQVRSGSSEGDE